MSSTASAHRNDQAPIEAPTLSFDEIAAWFDEVLAILDATSAVAPLGSVGLQRWALDQLTPLEAVVPWLVTEMEEADIEVQQSQDARWLLLQAETVTAKLRLHVTATPPLAA